MIKNNYNLFLYQFLHLHYKVENLNGRDALKTVVYARLKLLQIVGNSEAALQNK